MRVTRPSGPKSALRTRQVRFDFVLRNIICAGKLNSNPWFVWILETVGGNPNHFHGDGYLLDLIQEIEQ